MQQKKKTAVLKILQLTVGQLQSNCFLFFDEKSRECLIIDPGDDAEYIKQKILDLDLKPKKIIATHGHFDHIGAALDLQLSFDIPFLIHKKDEFLVKRVRETSLHFTGVDPGPPPKIGGYLSNRRPREALAKWGILIKVTPGHTPGSVSFYSKESSSLFVGDRHFETPPHSPERSEGYLFSGDLIFEKGGVGRTDFSYSSKIDLDNSIQKILKLPPETIVHSGHGPQFRLSEF